MDAIEQYIKAAKSRLRDSVADIHLGTKFAILYAGNK
jgi:hypothetical protein